jgi:hypothetical protein
MLRYNQHQNFMVATVWEGNMGVRDLTAVLLRKPFMASESFSDVVYGVVVALLRQLIQ